MVLSRIQRWRGIKDNMAVSPPSILQREREIEKRENGLFGFSVMHQTARSELARLGLPVIYTVMK
jgi:hypothetical protein